MTPTPAPPPPRVDWLHGLGASRLDRRLTLGMALAAVAIVGAALVLDAPALDGAGAWTWWRVAVVAVLLVDLVGGVVANASVPAKRLYHGPVPSSAGRLGRLLHDHMGFTALHIHPLVVAALLPDGSWWWGALWYGWALGGVAVVRAVPRRLERPVALGVATLGIVASAAIPAPVGLAWFPAVFLLKLVVAHAVDEPPIAASAER